MNSVFEECAIAFWNGMADSVNQWTELDDGEKEVVRNGLTAMLSHLASVQFPSDICKRGEHAVKNFSKSPAKAADAVMRLMVVSIKHQRTEVS